MAGGLSCGGGCLKYLMFIFNLLIWLLGCVVLGISIWLAVDVSAKERLGIASAGNNAMWDIAVYAMIGIGALIFILAFLGCCGAIKENSCMLMTYAVVLGILLVLEIIAGVLVVIFYQQIKTEIKTNMYKQVTTDFKDDTSTDTLHTAWNRQQQDLKCCGASGPFDWAGSVFRTKNPTKAVPLSCCKAKDTVTVTGCYKSALACTDVNNCPESTFLYTQGCVEGLQQLFESNAAILIGVAFAIAVIQIFGIIFACCLRKTIEDMNFLV